MVREGHEPEENLRPGYAAAGRRLRTSDELADFIDEQSAFVAQKGIYEYSRARAGHYAKVLFGEPEFIEAVDRSRWRAYPLGLAMVAELVDGVLRPHAGGDHLRQLDASARARALVFDRYPVPTTLGADAWRAARARAGSAGSSHIGLHPPKRAMEIPEPFARRLFRCSCRSTRSCEPAMRRPSTTISG